MSVVWSTCSMIESMVAMGSEISEDSSFEFELREGQQLDQKRYGV
jgi:hypothetical protein